MNINLLVYNVCMATPSVIRFNGQSRRCDMLVQSILELDKKHEFDAIVLVELMSPWEQSKLLKSLHKKGWH